MRFRLKTEHVGVVGGLVTSGVSVVGNALRLPPGLEVLDTGIRGDKPPAALVKHCDGRFSWVPVDSLEKVEGGVS